MPGEHQQTSRVDLGPFAKWVAFGLTPDLLPVVPANTAYPVEAGSALANPKRRAQIGKVPSYIKEGAIRGLGRWNESEMTLERLALFHELALEHGVTLNVGLRTQRWHALDIDCDNDALIAAILARYEGIIPLDESGLRIGRPPHVLALFEIDGPPRHKAVWLFKDPIEELHRVEWLGVGQYCVLGGVHPCGLRFRRVPYKGGRTIDDGMPTTMAMPAELDMAWAEIPAIAATLGMELVSSRHGRTANSHDGPGPSRAELLAPSIEMVKEALSYITLPAKGSTGQWDIGRWIGLGYELYGATGGSGDGLALWIEFSCDYDDQAEAHAEKAWSGFAKTERGWSQLRERAATESGGKYSTADQDFSSTREDTDARRAGAARAGDTCDTASSNKGSQGDGVGARDRSSDNCSKNNNGEIRPPAFSTDALALEFIDGEHARLRYVPIWGKWLVWNGIVWHEDDKLLTVALARHHCREVAESANEWIKTSLASANTIFSVERLARSDQRIVATADAWDQDPWLLNTPSGIVDLKTGNVRPHDSAVMITKCTAVGPDETMPMPLFTAFLSRITKKNDKLIDYLHRLLGYALTGSTREQMFSFWWGTGANGKSTLLTLVLRLWGDYGVMAPMSTFVAGAERHPTELAVLRGARLVAAMEVEQGRYWSEAKIKQLTGGDRIPARFMRQDFFEFSPTHTLIIAGNHRPGVRNVDHAMRRRLHFVPFTETIPEAERDKDLLDKLVLSEGPAIMAWAIAGCLEWLRVGLQPPEEVIGATDEYFAQEDSIALWLAECCTVGSDQHSLYDPLWESWRVWSERNNVRTNDRKALISTLIDRGFEKWRQPGSGQRGLQGISVARNPNQAGSQSNETATENPFEDTTSREGSGAFGPG